MLNTTINLTLKIFIRWWSIVDSDKFDFDENHVKVKRYESIMELNKTFDENSLIISKDNISGDNYEEYRQQKGRIKTAYKKRQNEGELSRTVTKWSLEFNLLILIVIFNPQINYF